MQYWRESSWKKPMPQIDGLGGFLVIWRSFFFDNSSMSRPLVRFRCRRRTLNVSLCIICLASREPEYPARTASQMKGFVLSYGARRDQLKLFRIVFRFFFIMKRFLKSNFYSTQVHESLPKINFIQNEIYTSRYRYWHWCFKRAFRSFLIFQFWGLLRVANNVRYIIF